MTPLIVAACNASDKTVSSLLSWGASPDQTDVNKNTALLGAIQSQCTTTITLLAPVTNVRLEAALGCLARDRIELEPRPLELLVERAAEDKDAALMGILHSAKFGASKIIELLAKYTKDHLVADTINIFPFPS